ncbi:MAG: hypothetical protein IPH62_07040 [Ignavibacteriae bacterium]|nr:hypothetical protein [Ignavibacteriota bacterium]
MKTKKLLNVFLIFAMVLILTNCDSTENNESTVTLSFANNSAIPKIAENNFQIQEVKILLRNIKIKNQADEDSLQIKTGPYVVNLNLNGNLTEFAVSDIPKGNYDRVKFEIHKLEASENPPDAVFKEGNEESLRYSIVVTGLLNGEQFIYKSKKSAKQDVKLAEDIIVDENENVNLTIKVDVNSWFYEDENFLNPNDAGNDDKIDNNIKNNFKNAYRDQNKDGQID